MQNSITLTKYNEFQFRQKFIHNFHDTVEFHILNVLLTMKDLHDDFMMKYTLFIIDVSFHILNNNIYMTLQPLYTIFMTHKDVEFHILNVTMKQDLHDDFMMKYTIFIIDVSFHILNNNIYMTFIHNKGTNLKIPKKYFLTLHNCNYNTAIQYQMVKHHRCHM